MKYVPFLSFLSLLVIMSQQTLAQPNPYIFDSNETLSYYDPQNETTGLIMDNITSIGSVHPSSTKMYFAINNNTLLQYSDLDGGNRQTLWQGKDGFAGRRFVVSTAFDFKANKGYFTTSGTGLENLAGNFLLSVDLNTKQIDTLINTDKFLTAIAVDTLNNHLYYVRYPDGLYQSDLSGQNETLIISADAFDIAPTQLAIDPDDQMIYWVETNGSINAIRKVERDGTGFTTVIPNNIEAQLGVYFDFKNDRIYCNPFGSILSTNLDGQDVMFLETGFTNNANDPIPSFTMDDTFYYQFVRDEIVRTHRTTADQKILLKGTYSNWYFLDQVSGRLFYRLRDTDMSFNQAYKNKVLSVNLEGGDFIIHDAPNIDTKPSGWLIYDNEILYTNVNNDIDYIMAIDLQTTHTDTLATGMDFFDFLLGLPNILDYFPIPYDLQANKRYFFIGDGLYQGNFDRSDPQPIILFGLDDPINLNINKTDNRFYWINQGINRPGFFSANRDGSDIQKISDQIFNRFTFYYPNTPPPPQNTPPSFQVSTDHITLDQDFNTPQIITVIPDPIKDGEENQTVTYSINPTTSDLVSIDFDPQTGQVTLTSIKGIFGQQEFMIMADDGQRKNNTFQIGFTLNINEVETVITSIDPETQIKIYPNPTHDYVTISGITLGDIWITDLSGKTVLSKVKITDQTPINIQHLNTGIYHLHLHNNTNQHMEVFRLIKSTQ